jgi:membrane-bound serine protease (ClpP class)
MMIGLYGLLFELYNPGLIFPGVVGAISLLIALYAMQTLPVNYAGAALMILSIVFFILELKIASHGILGIGGAISLLLGSMMLIRTDELFTVGPVSLGVILPTVAFTVLFFLVAISAALKAQHRPPTTGTEAMIGAHGIAATDLGPDGRVTILGESWEATSLEGTIRKGSPIIVDSLEGLAVKVKKSPAANA